MTEAWPERRAQLVSSGMPCHEAIAAGRLIDQEYTPQKKFIAAMTEGLRAELEQSPVGRRRFRGPGGGVRLVP